MASLKIEEPLAMQGTQPRASVRSSGGTSVGLLPHSLLYAILTVLTLLVHGYHPFADDGGLYAAGIEKLLDRNLFPHDTAFVTEHLRFSIFAPLMAGVVRHSFLSLESVLLLVYLLSTAFTFAGADYLLRGLEVKPRSRLGALLLLCAWWTLPIAGTSLYLEDPYLTARTVAFAFSVWALALSLPKRGGPGQRRGAAQYFLPVFCWLAAFALHPLMTGYAFALLVCVFAVRSAVPGRASLACTGGALLLAGVVQGHGAAEAPEVFAASLSRYYWFLSRWEWFELLGLAGPLVVLLCLLRSRMPGLSAAGRDLVRACLLLGGIALLVSIAYAHVSFASHAVARLQPLRAFLMIYAVMILLLGSVAEAWWQTMRSQTLPVQHIVGRHRGAHGGQLIARIVAGCTVVRCGFTRRYHVPGAASRVLRLSTS